MEYGAGAGFSKCSASVGLPVRAGLPDQDAQGKVIHFAQTDASPTTKKRVNASLSGMCPFLYYKGDSPFQSFSNYELPSVPEERETGGSHAASSRSLFFRA